MKNVFYQTKTARGSASPQAAAPRRLRTKRLIALAAALLCGMNWAWAYDRQYDFSITYGSNTLYFAKIGNSTTEVAVVCPFFTPLSVQDGYQSFLKPTGELAIPQTVQYNGQTYTVKRIGEKAFKECTGLTKVTINAYVTEIKDRAFDGCTALTSVSFRPSYLTKIGDNAFKGCSSLLSVSIPNSVTHIGVYAFQDCTSLTSVTIPNSVTNIGSSAFNGCTGLTSVTIPNSVTYIGSSAFDGCTSVTSVTIPNSVTYIGDAAFRNCHPNISSITISSSVTDIGSKAFEGWGLTSVTLNSNDVVSKDFSIDVNYDNKGFCSIFGDQVELYTIGSNVTKIGKYAFADCTGLTSVTIPSSVTEIGYSAFRDCTGLTSVTLNYGLNTIDSDAFEGCTGLTSITFPSSVEKIFSDAFTGCTGLTSVTIPSSVTVLGGSAFRNCTGLTKVIVNSNSVVSAEYNNMNGFQSIFGNQVKTYMFGSEVTAIGEYALYNCTGVTKVIFYGNLTTIEMYAFSGCTGLTSIQLPNTVTAIKHAAFSQCTGLTTLNLPNSLTSIGVDAFSGCTGLTSLNFSNSLTSIGMNAFSGCTGLTSLNFPNSLTSIGVLAFSGCTGLTTLKFPNSLTSINMYAFSGCTNIQAMTVRAVEPPTATANTFENVPKNIHVYVPSGSIQAYKSATGWKDFYNISDDSYIVFADGTVNGICLQNWDTNNDGKLSYIEAEDITDIGTLFKGKIIHSFDELQYFTGLTSIPSNAFEGCAALTSITFPNSLTSINSSAFKNCANLSSIVIPSSVTYFDGYALNGCTELAQIVVESGNTKYDSRNGCNAIIKTADNTLIAGCKTTVIPDDVTSIGYYAFYNCTGLTSIEIPNTVTYIGGYAFKGCTGLTSIQLPSSLTTIREEAFRSCSGLTSITIPNLVTTIGENAFLFCESLTSLVIGSSVTTIGNYAFSGCRAIERITVLATTPPPMNNSTAFSSVPSSTPLYVPCGTSEAYQNATCWSRFSNIVEVCNIEFEDPLVKDICVANWDTNGDGELSTVEAEAVTDLNNKFEANDQITSFDELQYFTGLTFISNFQFCECTSLTSITIPSSVTSIGSHAFQDCTGLAQIVVESGNTKYDSRNNCNAIIETATNTLFAGCKTTVIPDDVTSIGYYAFGGCTGLTSVEIPQSITSIKYYAFEGCTGLESITVLATTPPALDNNVFYNVPTNIPVYVPCGSRDAYIAAEGWNEFTNIGGDCYIEFEDPLVKEICVANWDTNDDGELSYAEAAAVVGLNSKFEANDQITSFDELQYFTGLTDIGAAEFIDCTSLTSIILPPNITMITEYAFSGCSFTSITLPEKLTYIDEGAFQGCTSLTSITLPEGLIKICCYAFDGTGLESISIPASVTEIELEAFFCSNLESIEVHPDNTIYTSNNGCNLIVEKASNTVILGCANSDIYEGVQQIERYAFYNVTGTLTLPSTLKGIGVGAFYDCTNLASIRVNATTPPTLDTDAFKNVTTTIPVYVPCGSLAAYQSAEGWSTFTNMQEDCNITLTIAGYGDDPTTTEGWNLIASPLMYNVFPEDVENMTSNNYDLYAFDGLYEGAEWRNHKNNAVNEFNTLSSGVGYLYANSETVTLIFKGEPLSVNSYVKELDAYDTKFGHWNLIGNSFTTEATVSVTDYYRIEPGTRTLMLSSGNVNPMEGIFVEYNSTLDEVTFNKATRGERAIESPMVNIDLRNAEGHLLDRARLRTGEGAQLSKLDMLSDPNRLYFRIDGKDYAVARVNGQGEMPLHFDAAQNGTYSLNVNVEGMEMAYLHLIDNMTGEDVDLLAQNGGDARHCVSTYTFTGKPSDYASRFRLVFETGSSAEGDSFAFIDAAGNIVITNAEAGATLQVIDVMGRVVLSTDVARGVSTKGMTAGVYVLRLINGNDVMTQKIVVE